MAFVSAQQLQHSIILSGALLLGSKPLGKHGDQQLIHALEPAAVNAALKREQRNVLRNGGGLSNLREQCSGIAQPNAADGAEGKPLFGFGIALDMTCMDLAQIDHRAAAGE